jgi:hypothetical protein
MSSAPAKARATDCRKTGHVATTGFFHGNNCDLENRDSASLTMTAYKTILYETVEQRKRQKDAVGVRTKAEHFGLAVLLLVVLMIA